MDGTSTVGQDRSVDSAEDSTTAPIKMEYPGGLTPVHFLRLTLTRGGDRTISDNFYLRGIEDGDYRAIRALPKAKPRGHHHRRADRAALASDHRAAQCLGTAGADGLS